MKQFFKTIPAFLILSIGLFTSFWIYSIFEKRALEVKEEQISNVIDNNVDNIQKELSVSFASIEILQSIFEEQNFISKEEFKNYTTPLFKRNSGLKALSWVPKILNTERPIFEKSLHNPLQYNFINERDSKNEVIVGKEESFYFPVAFIEPFEENKQALGFNIYSDSSRQKTIDSAIKKRELVITPRIKIVQDTLGYSLLGIMPVYNVPEKETTVENVKGLISAVFKIDRLVNDALLNTKDPIFMVVIFDITNNKKELIYGVESQRNTQERVDKRIISVAGRTWELNFMIKPDYLKVAGFGVYLFAGIIFSLMLFIILLFPVLKEKRRQILTEKLTKEQQIRISAEESLFESEEKYKYMFENNPQPMWIFDLETLAFLEVNNAAIAHYGYSKEEFLSMTVKDIRPKEDVHLFLKTKFLTGNLNFAGEWNHLKKNGEVIIVEITFHAVTFNGRKARHVIANDITERKKIEASLKESNNRLAAIMKNINEGLMLADYQGNVIYWNPAALATFGYASMDECKRQLNQFADTFEVRTLNDDRILTVDEWPMSRVMRGELLRDWEVRLSRIDQGWEKILAYSGFLIESDSGEKLVIVSTIDITERKQVEEELKQSEEKFSNAFYTSPAAMSIARVSDGLFLDANSSFLNMFEFKREELVGHTSIELNLIGPEERSKIMHQIKETGELINFELILKSKSGKNINVLVSSKPIKIKDDACNLTTMIDITSRIQAEEALKKSEEKFSASFHVSPVGLAITRISDGNFIDVNDSFLKIFEFEREEVIGHTSIEINMLSPEARAKIIKMQLETGGLRNNELVTQSKSGRIVHLLFSSNPIKIEDVDCHVTTMVDISDRKLAEKKLQTSEEQFRAYVEQAADPLFVHDSEGNFIAVNQQACESLGYTREELMNLNLFDIEIDFDLARAKEAWSHFNTNEHFTLVGHQRRKDGSTFHVEASFGCFDIDGKRQFIVQARDITERLEAQEALKKSEEEFRNLAESMPQIVWTTRADGWNTYFNQQWMDYTGLTLEESYGHGWNIPFHPKDQQRAWDAWQNAVNNNGSYSIEVRLRRFDGEYRWWLIRGIPMLNENGEILKWFGTCTDIEDIKQAEESIISTKKQLENISNSLPVFIAQCDATKYYKFVNEPYSEMFGLQPADIIGKHPKEILGEKAFEFANPYMNTVLSGTPTHYEFVLSNSVNEEKILNVNYVPDIDETGTVVGFIAAITDITEEKKKGELLRESEELLRLSTELANVAAWEMDLVANSMTRSSNHDNLYGLKDVGTWQVNTFLDATHVDDREKCNFFINQSIASGGPDEYKFDFRIHYPDQSIHWLNVIGVVIERNANGVGTKIRGFITDITDRKEAEEAIKQLNIELEQRVLDRTEKLEATNKELQTFTYSVSHDLKAPLRGIDGYSNLLQELYAKDLNDEAKNFIRLIRNGTMQMNNLIEDLLEYSRLERATLRTETIHIKDFIQKLKTQFEAQISAAKFTVIIHCPDIKITTDSKGLTIALRNLLDNAIKFSRKNKKPIVEISLVNKTKFIIISVKDNGIGFDMQYKERIFDIFQQLNLPEEFPGTGIGLAMVYKSIEKMGGKVWAESSPRKGATFYLEIPKQKTP
ncbi:PAS domain S-box protein [Lutibacter sp.]|uniref:PAS domain S-box protein n=1 Tax=Lutibacter sp. TaxID=1925666 RepID=UPI001A331859|nr:PAS domain S-box protein [Lutibacter sp.]MBI9041939.1 PAS domain S-box protein [Lutibacter sp.]